VLSNILLTPFDWEMRARGYQLTRYADDWVVTCTSEAEAAKAIADAERILAQLGVQLHPQKTRIVPINRGFDFVGTRSSEGDRALRCAASWVVMPRRERCMPTRARSRSTGSKTRSGS
jgi:RNA-directed DNA polymerase